MDDEHKVTDEITDESERNLKKTSLLILSIIAFLYALFHFYTAAVGPFPNIIQRSIHVLVAVIMVFISYKPFARKKVSDKIPWLDVVFVLFISFTSVYMVINYDSIITSSASSTTFQVILGWGTVILLLEAARRVMGIVFPLLAILAILYGFLGPYLPGVWAHNGIDYEFMIQHLFLGTQGLWGVTTSVTATTVAIFIIFGVVLMKSGAADFFMNLALLIAGRTTGGPAKVAVLASTFFSMLSGSAPANVAVTGNITIPMMTRLKYDKNFAGAVESTASTGGQLTPPVMGAGAFLIAEFVGVSYVEVVIAAIIPAFLYYISVFFSVHWRSARLGYNPLEKSQIPSVKDTFKIGNVLVTVLPVVVLMVNLFGGSSPARAGFLATLVCIILFILKKLKDSKILDSFKELAAMFVEAGKGLIMIAILAGTAQIIVGLLSITGLGIKLSNFLLSMSGEIPIITLLLAMIVCIILGMGMPTTAAYLLASSTLAPTIITLGYDALASHIFVFYFAVISAITPPVCVAVFVACGISKGNWFKTATMACLIGFPAFIVPYIFISSESFLLMGGISNIIISITTATVGIIVISGGLMGNFLGNLITISRIILIVGGGLLLLTGWISNVIGLVIVVLYLITKMFLNKQQVRKAEEKTSS